MSGKQNHGPIGDELRSPDLAARVRSGDPEALQKVVKAYLRQIVRAARGAGLGPEEADDVAQATFVTFLENRERFEGRSTVRTWLFGILFRKVAEARRGFQRDRRNDPIEDVMERRFLPDPSSHTRSLLGGGGGSGGGGGLAVGPDPPPPPQADNRTAIQSRNILLIRLPSRLVHTY